MGVTFVFGAELPQKRTKFKRDVYETHLKARVFALLLREREVI